MGQGTDRGVFKRRSVLFGVRGNRAQEARVSGLAPEAGARRQRMARSGGPDRGPMGSGGAPDAALALNTRAQPLLLLPELGSEFGAEVLGFEHLPNLDLRLVAGGV